VHLMCAVYCVYAVRDCRAVRVVMCTCDRVAQWYQSTLPFLSTMKVRMCVVCDVTVPTHRSRKLRLTSYRYVVSCRARETSHRHVWSARVVHVVYVCSLHVRVRVCSV
jgi:hypothetical protein